MSRMNEPKGLSKNRIIMNMVVEYVMRFQIKREGISRLNQVWIYEKMILPCELIGFLGKQKQKKQEKKMKKAVKSRSTDLTKY